MRSLMFATGTAAALVFGRTAAAQSDQVPRELLDALLRGIGGSGGITAELFVGRLPEGFAPNVEMRRGARVLGGIVVQGVTMVVVTSPLAPDSAVSDLGRQVRALGWEPKTAPPTRGFVPAEPRAIATYCRNGSPLTMRGTARSRGGTEVVLIGGRDAGPSCDVDSASDPSMALPALIAPPSTGSHEMCDGRPIRHPVTSSTMTMVQTTLPPDSILLHYGEQLEKAGWKTTTLTAATRAMAWTHTDSTRRIRDANIEVAPSSDTPGCYSVTMTVALRSAR